ncbi:DUF2946 family protein [Inhella gelatinilytica]|uniref:DUF2946 family protein n=1 Tax=Inhella gelatinilytica TaxID=2795030 RepID=A0A931J1G1_9BURK|nr:DUF2946 family protein [Inhella gelatinilytica]MBH9553606.1 DUF2946 family protein [Inhella gelatinilytica]
MDDLVRAAMAKWPQVPDCRGWLALDARGDWYMRDEACQRAGAFPNPKGSRVVHDKLLAFIARNYEVDSQGRWFFQNGPQRVYVVLESAPWVLRVQPDGTVRTHTGRAVQVLSAWLDEYGWLYLGTDAGLGLVHSQDMVQAVDRVESGGWCPESVTRAELPARFGFVLEP